MQLRRCLIWFLLCHLFDSFWWKQLIRVATFSLRVPSFNILNQIWWLTLDILGAWRFGGEFFGIRGWCDIYQFNMEMISSKGYVLGCSPILETVIDHSICSRAIPELLPWKLTAFSPWKMVGRQASDWKNRLKLVLFWRSPTIVVRLVHRAPLKLLGKMVWLLLKKLLPAPGC